MHFNPIALKTAKTLSWLGFVFFLGGGVGGGGGFTGPLRQYFSLYRAVSQREKERNEER